MNCVQIIGRLTRDVDYRTSQSGTGVARYTLAVDRRWKREGDDQNADFISCVAFGKSAEFAQKFFTKGMRVGVTGRLQTGSYEKEGHTVYTTDVIVETQDFADGKSSRANEPEITHGVVEDDDELPF